MAQAGFDRLVEQAQGDARKLAALSALALWNGPVERAYELARLARMLAPDDPEIRSMTESPLAANVPHWHFRIVRDLVRNEAYEAALRRAVGPDSRVLDIGSGTGLLALMAARAGAGAVVTCEMNPAVADAAADIVALNGYADRVRVIAKRSSDLDVETDMGGPADILVSEIVSYDMLAEAVLPVMEDAVPRLLKPGGRVIPASGQLRVALGWWQGLADQRLGDVAGFDLSPFNRLEGGSHRLKVGDPGLSLRSPPGDLFDFDFASGGPYPSRETHLDLVSDGGEVNGVVQWIRLRMDAEGIYENRPGPGAASCWAARFHPLLRALATVPGETVRVRGAHGRGHVRIWSEA